MKHTIKTIIYASIAAIAAWMPAEAEALKIKFEPSLIFHNSHTRTYPERVPVRRVYPAPVRVAPPMQPLSYEVYPYYNPVTGYVEYYHEPVYPPLPAPIPHYHTESQGIDLQLKFR